MTSLALLIGILITALGVLGLVSPARLMTLDQFFQTPAGLFATGVIRLILGAVLFLAAPESRAPTVLQVFGVVVFVAGVVTLPLGLERFRGFVERWVDRRPALVRPFAVVALVLGVLLSYAFLP